jgi:4-carboxymuconolactone decarboxylase
MNQEVIQVKVTRFEEGQKQLKKVDGVGGEKVIKSLRDIAPDVGKYIIEFAFGDIYSREELSLKEREIITMTSLLTMGGCEPQLEVHINGALNVGAAPQKIIETFIQCIPYVGFPKVLNAIFTAKKIFSEREIRL